MAEITASLVKELRDRTGAGMMDAKKALAESGGDLDKAVQRLRESGQLKAEKKAGRATNEGRIGACVSGTAAALVEIQCETDFVARNPQFIAFADKVAQSMAKAAPGAPVDGTPFVDGGTVSDALKERVLTIGENLKIGKTVRLDTPDGFFGVYIHNNGKIGVLTKFKGKADDAGAAIAKQVSMHVAGHDPQPVALDRTGVSAARVEQEKAIFRKQAETEGKPANMLDKIAEGKLNAFYKQNVLLEQMFVIDPKRSIKDVVKAAGPFELVDFKLVAIGGE